VPGAFITRWLAVIRTYDFMVWHIKRTENVIADILFYKPLGLSNNDNRRIKGNIKNWCKLTLRYTAIVEAN
jgi:hypothetical protein